VNNSQMPKNVGVSR